MGDRVRLIVLDTHAWLWWSAAPEKLSARARKAIASADRLAVATVSVYELAALEQRRRIELDRDVGAWVGAALADERFDALPLTTEIALAAARLESEGFHGDPADRIIYATAREAAAPLVTRDDRIRRFDRTLTLW